MPPYAPEEDSYFLSGFLAEIVKRERPKKVLDMGSGSGIQGETALKSGVGEEDLTLVDEDEKSVENLRKKFPKSLVARSDLFRDLNGNEKHDLMVFNPPYLPENELDGGKDTTGGKRGSETMNEFLRRAKDHLTENGSILILASSFTEGIDFSGYKKELLGEKNLFFEKLSVWKLSPF